ncbi:hypothetical protein SERLA73DRAFT_73630 [Serpula lacrymans var. lacrymans S7.3]|uniref:Uncharacterized protein n=1 Tax=Serpula lacrymans var. lacrymans (strain S7.3) TaxID=936435 RepID=F8PYU5_SERL3|nr:hypothetical protein SERLA73DRAFT_73630 [Serpula lacrymans var. lacrymans S7.3]
MAMMLDDNDNTDSNLQHLEQELVKVVSDIKKKEAKLAEINLKAGLKKKGGGKQSQEMTEGQVKDLKRTMFMLKAKIEHIKAINNISASKAMAQGGLTTTNGPPTGGEGTNFDNQMAS